MLLHIILLTNLANLVVLRLSVRIELSLILNLLSVNVWLERRIKLLR